jgi:DNA-binding response OmpR family regulator
MEGRNSQTLGRLFVVEDDPGTLGVVMAVAARQGHVVVQALNGREAYRILSKDAGFVAAVIDLTTRGLDGTDLLKYMQSERRLQRIPVLVLTSADCPLLPQEGFGGGAVALMPKPFTSQQLSNLIRVLAARRQFRREWSLEEKRSA